MARRPGWMAGLLFVAVAAAAGTGSATETPPTCSPDGGAVEFEGRVTDADAKTYELLPFSVAEGTTRVEVGYDWRPDEDDTTLDLGLWDEDGPGTPAGFRGWSGSRQGHLDDTHDTMGPIWVQADSAERGYRPGPVEPGIWNVDLGIASVAAGGARWRVEVRCLAVDVGDEPEPDPVDPTHVAREEPGWYEGDMHLHAFHSNPEGPAGAEVVEYARDAGLDFVPVTEYVTDRHWFELGETQRENPDLVIWPGREVITYFGHAIVLGETPSTIEYRHGFDDVSLAGIQADAVADGALFQIAHPTIFPGEAFESYCRGCEFELSDEIDWDLVTSIEVVTGPVLVGADFGPVDPGEGGFANPFVSTAIEFWEERLLAGYKITAVSGSDDKLGPEYGITTTAVYADQLSRAALAEAIRAGHAYVQTRGVDGSPKLDLEARAPDGETGMFGDTLVTDSAVVDVTVRRGVGQTLGIVANGETVEEVPIDADPFTYTFTADRRPGEGPLGTFWRVETADAESLTTISNPVFLADQPYEPPDSPAPATLDLDVDDDGGGGGDRDPGPWIALGAAAVVVIGAGAWAYERSRRRRRATSGSEAEEIRSRGTRPSAG